MLANGDCWLHNQTKFNNNRCPGRCHLSPDVLSIFLLTTSLWFLLFWLLRLTSEPAAFSLREFTLTSENIVVVLFVCLHLAHPVRQPLSVRDALRSALLQLSVKVCASHLSGMGILQGQGESLRRRGGFYTEEVILLPWRWLCWSLCHPFKWDYYTLFEIVSP